MLWFPYAQSLWDLAKVGISMACMFTKFSFEMWSWGIVTACDDC